MSRFIPKIFAENATDNVVFGSWWEQGGTVGDGTVSNDPATLQGNAAWPLGLGAATNNFFKLMRSEELNGVLRVITTAILQQMKDGLTFWQPEMPVTQYQTIVQYQTGSDRPKLYVNITGASTSTPPDSDTTNWFMFLDTAQVSANIALTNSPYTTNRILEIPQDIKLELNNGTLTLKAGSKVYVPNGFEQDGTTPKFDVVTISQNQTSSKPTATYSRLVFVYNPNSPSDFSSTSELACFSGPTAPSAYNTMIWYDTSTNLVKLTANQGNTWSSGYSLPYAIASTTASDGFVSINQIFNGFGYIGSHIFALPGVKVQSPNGKNEDGTYKTIIRTIDSVKTYDAGEWITHNLNIFLSGSSLTPIFEAQAIERFTYNKKFSSDISTYSYDENTGIWWYSADQSSWFQFSGNILGSVTVTSGRVTSFSVHSVDSVANSNASNFSQAGRSYLSGLGMPSNRYIDLTLLANGNTYTAPANGYFQLSGINANGVKALGFTNTSVSLYSYIHANALNGSYGGIIMPAKRGNVVKAEYGGFSSYQFKFVYAEGEN